MGDENDQQKLNSEETPNAEESMQSSAETSVADGFVANGGVSNESDGTDVRDTTAESNPSDGQDDDNEPTLTERNLSSFQSDFDPKLAAAASVSSEAKTSRKNAKGPEGSKGPIDLLYSIPRKLLYTATGLIAAIAVVAILFSTHIVCFHEWADATCTEPKTCEICGATEGDALGHDWVDATCFAPKTCERCGATVGSALGHDIAKWDVVKESTCFENGVEEGTCARCERKISNDLPLKDHTEGEWKVTAEPVLNSDGSVTPGERELCCAVCGQAIKTEEYTKSAEELIADYKKACSDPSFEDVARNPDDWEGKQVEFTGEVIQVMEDAGTYTLRVNVTQTSWGWDDTIMVIYSSPDGASRILEDDVVTFYGLMGGMYSYESVMGATITVPLLFASYADM